MNGSPNGSRGQRFCNGHGREAQGTAVVVQIEGGLLFPVRKGHQAAPAAGLSLGERPHRDPGGG